MKIKVNCVDCRKLHEFEASEEGLKAWRAGKLIQDALPGLTSDQRELMISGLCGKCWDKLFSGEEY